MPSRAWKVLATAEVTKKGEATLHTESSTGLACRTFPRCCCKSTTGILSYPFFAEICRKHKLHPISREGVKVVTEAERAKTRSVVGLNPMDLGPILFGKLTKDGHADSNVPIATAFIKEKLLASRNKVFY